MKSVLVFVTLCIGAVFMIDCSDKPDGIYEAGCKSFVTCSNGVATTTECEGNQVFNPEIEACDDPDNVEAPCGQMIDCTEKEDGKYPDLDNDCKSYYTCLNGNFFGHNFCPDGLVFNQSSQICDWAYNVAPPCGTKVPDEN